MNVAFTFQNYQFVAFTDFQEKFKTINLWLFNYQFVAFNYQFVAFSLLWITLQTLVNTSFFGYLIFIFAPLSI